MVAARRAAADAGDAARLRALLDGEGPRFDERLLDAFETYVFAEQRAPRRPQAYVEHGEHLFALAPHFAFGAYERADALFWPIRPRGTFYGPFRHAAGATPALLMHMTHDAATPFAWGAACGATTATRSC